MILLCSVCLGCKDFFMARHLSGAAKLYEEVFILTLKKIDSFLKDKAEVNWDFLKRIEGHSITLCQRNLSTTFCLIPLVKQIFSLQSKIPDLSSAMNICMVNR